ncbi:type II toxin-antitoxin system RelE/ParE family toxin [Vreelandella titanicae]|uniref:type II toxin-antitoxin system RelE/ParE family toxin n=1 Tax=Vreelandella titanicae TaxID=664683 RepID=UPI0030B90A30|nr:type II toxin-antitoxin system RelE/ParE family toxin [Halomonas titanicae]|tara:strand:- start:108 stop:332 length:225 start_codon:yes stop_codon:yes gene_type:complete
MLLVEWRPQARESLWSILYYLSQHNPFAAEALYQAIEEATEAAGYPSIPTCIAQVALWVPEKLWCTPTILWFTA